MPALQYKILIPKECGIAETTVCKQTGCLPYKYLPDKYWRLFKFPS